MPGTAKPQTSTAVPTDAKVKSTYSTRTPRKAAKVVRKPKPTSTGPAATEAVGAGPARKSTPKTARKPAAATPGGKKKVTPKATAKKAVSGKGKANSSRQARRSGLLETPAPASSATQPERAEQPVLDTGAQPPPSKAFNWIAWCGSWPRLIGLLLVAFVGGLLAQAWLGSGTEPAAKAPAGVGSDRVREVVPPPQVRAPAPASPPSYSRQIPPLPYYPADTTPGVEPGYATDWSQYGNSNRYPAGGWNASPAKPRFRPWESKPGYSEPAPRPAPKPYGQQFAQPYGGAAGQPAPFTARPW